MVSARRNWIDAHCFMAFHYQHGCDDSENHAKLLWLIIMVWAWPLTARFENSVMATLRNALLFGGTSPFTTLAALIIPAIAIGLTVASLQWLPKGLYLLLILGFGIVVQLQIPLFEHALKPYVNKVAA